MGVLQIERNASRLEASMNFQRFYACPLLRMERMNYIAVIKMYTRSQGRQKPPPQDRHVDSI